MKLDEINELSDMEKWDWVIDNITKVELYDEDEVYFTVYDEENEENIEIIFNEPLEMDEALATLFRSIGFISHNY